MTRPQEVQLLLSRSQVRHSELHTWQTKALANWPPGQVRLQVLVPWIRKKSLEPLLAHWVQEKRSPPKHLAHYAEQP